MKKFLLLLLIFIPINSFSGQITGKIKSVSSIIKNCSSTNKSCVIIELTKEINNSPNCANAYPSSFVLELPKDNEHIFEIYQILNKAISIDYFSLLGTGKCSINPRRETLYVNSVTKIGMKLQPPMGNGLWKITDPYNYNNHKCNGNYFRPSSDNGNPACDSYALDFMPIQKDTCILEDPDVRLVHAVEEGTVVIAKEQGLYGLTVLIDHGSNIYSRYAHLKNIDLRIKVNKKIRAGSTLGEVGNTTSKPEGYGKHLHFSMYKVKGNKAYSFKPEPLAGMTNFDSGFYSNKVIFVDGRAMQDTKKCSN